MARWATIGAAYALLGTFAAVVAVGLRSQSPLVHPEPWLQLATRSSHTYSALFGLAFGGLVVLASRWAVDRFAWARGLHGALRPFARSMGTPTIVVVAILSSFGEELLFRGLLQPWVGLVPQALIFGIAHQVPGKSRWVWAFWATVVGLAFGAMFQLSGSLVGPLIAHALVNALNLAYLRSHDPAHRRELGGLLTQNPRG